MAWGTKYRNDQTVVSATPVSAMSMSVVRRRSFEKSVDTGGGAVCFAALHLLFQRELRSEST